MQEKDLRKDRPAFERFCSHVEEGIQKRLGEDAKAVVHETHKNNGLKLQGLNILQKGYNFTQTFYLDAHYEEYLNGRSLSDIVNEIIHIYSEGGISKHVDAGFYTDWEEVRKRVLFRLVNYEKNQDFLSEVSHKRFLDLAIVYYVPVEEFENGYSAITVYSTHMNIWGKTVDDLHREALRNTPDDMPYGIMSLDSLAKEVMPEEAGDAEEEDIMYILTNSYKFFGASAILYPNVLKKFADRLGEDFFILPSSLHETILVPVHLKSPEMLAMMVCYVNRKQIPLEEYLSDSVYKYSRETGEITVAVEGGFYE